MSTEIVKKVVVTPSSRLQILSKHEIDNLFLMTQNQEKFESFKRCAFATLVSVRGEHQKLSQCDHLYENFKISLTPRNRGISIVLENVPAIAFVKHEDLGGGITYDLIRGVSENLFSVCRDLLYNNAEIFEGRRFDLSTAFGRTNAVFTALRHAGVFQERSSLPLVVCWGGHRVPQDEYDYSVEVGYQLGLRNLDICTGSGPGIMCGPMEGAAVAHAKQRITNARYVGLLEPEIIAGEPPNPIVNHLIVMPDIEKRLESFVRLGHAFIIFPGGAGTFEEICYLYGILMDPANKWMNDIPFILTGNEKSGAYLNMVKRFIQGVLGEGASDRCAVIENEPEKVAMLAETITQVTLKKRVSDQDDYQDSDYFSWRLHIDPLIHQRFKPTYENVQKINLYETKPHLLAGHLRNFFSAVVAAGIKAEGIKEVERYGPFKVKAPRYIADALNELIESFIDQGRMPPRQKGDRYFEFQT